MLAALGRRAIAGFAVIGGVVTLTFVLLLLGKEAQEYFLHFDRFLDNFTAFEAVNGIWRTLFGR